MSPFTTNWFSSLPPIVPIERAAVRGGICLMARGTQSSPVRPPMQATRLATPGAVLIRRAKCFGAIRHLWPPGVMLTGSPGLVALARTLWAADPPEAICPSGVAAGLGTMAPMVVAGALVPVRRLADAFGLRAPFHWLSSTNRACTVPADGTAWRSAGSTPHAA